MVRPFFRRTPPWTVLAAIAALLSIGVPVGAVGLSLLAPGSGTLAHLADTRLTGYVANSLVLMLGVGAGVAILGTLSAWAVSAYRFPGSRLFAWALALPIALPPYIVAYAYTDFLQAGGGLYLATGLSVPGVRSLPTAIAVLSLCFYPYVFLAARAAFAVQDAAPLDSARMMGARGLGLFTRVALPLAWPAVAAGVALALMETLADFGTVSFFGVQTFTTGIYQVWFGQGDMQAAARLSAALLAFVAFALLLERLARGRRRFSGRAHRRLAPLPVTGAVGWGLTALCALPLILGFALPVVLLGHGAMTAAYGGRGDMAEILAATLSLGGLAAGIAVLLALIFGAARRFAASRRVHLAISAANFGYALPGSVIAVGLLIPLTGLDRRLIDWGLADGLLLTGSAVALVLAYQVRFLPLALRPLEAGWTKIGRQIDDVGQTLGAGSGTLFWRLHAPLLRGSTGAAALLVFVETVKELPATLILRPFNLDTLAVRAHQLAADERLAQAALPSVIIAAIGLLPILLLSARLPRRTKPATPAPMTEGFV